MGTPGQGPAWLVELGHRWDLLVDLPSCAAAWGDALPPGFVRRSTVVLELVRTRGIRLSN